MKHLFSFLFDNATLSLRAGKYCHAMLVLGITVPIRSDSMEKVVQCDCRTKLMVSQVLTKYISRHTVTSNSIDISGAGLNNQTIVTCYRKALHRSRYCCYLPGKVVEVFC